MFKRALPATALAAAITVGAGGVADAHNTLPDPNRILGTCTSVFAGTIQQRHCFPDERPYLGPTTQFGGADRYETGRLIWERAHLGGGWAPGTVFIGRVEDGSALGLAAAATEGGVHVTFAGRGDDVDQAALEQLVALHESDEPGDRAMVVIGGDDAMGVPVQLAAAYALFTGWAGQ